MLIRKGPKNPVRGTKEVQRGKARNWKHRNGAGRDDPERLERSMLGGGAKAERAMKKVSRFAEGLGQER